VEQLKKRFNEQEFALKNGKIIAIEGVAVPSHPSFIFEKYF
jgi:hypothetical protein